MLIGPIGVTRSARSTIQIYIMLYAKTSIMGTNGNIKGWSVFINDEWLYVCISVHKTIPAQNPNFQFRDQTFLKLNFLGDGG